MSDVNVYLVSVNDNGQTPQAVGTGGANPAGVVVNPIVSLGTVFNPPQSAQLPPVINPINLGLAPADAPVNFPAISQLVPNPINVDGASTPANGAPIQSPPIANFYR